MRSLVALMILAGLSMPGATASAVPAGGSHAGQTDTDGVLSPGERPNPDIDYNEAQREGDRRGDERLDNPDNDREAARDREEDRSRGRYDWDNPMDRGAWEHDQYRSDEQKKSWWQW